MRFLGKLVHPIQAMAILLCCIAVGHAQPYLAYRGIYNSASYMAAGLPGGAIARGSVFSLFGNNIGPATTPQLSFPLQTTLASVSISVSQGSTTVNALPIAFAAGQINAIMPSNAPLGAVSIRVTYNSSRSNPIPAQVVNSNFGIFTANSAGDGPGVLQNFVSAAVQPINSLQTPATPGQVIVLWGTGMGAVAYADNVAPSAGNLPVQTEVFIGGVKANVQYNGRTPCCAGIDQIVFTVPAQPPLGCWVPVYVRTGGTAVSNVVTMAITSDGSPCQEPNNALASALIKGGKIGNYAAARIAVHHSVAVTQTLDATADLLGTFQAQEKQGPFNFNPLFSLPPPGTCTSYSMIGDRSSDPNVSIAGMTPPSGPSLDAGLVSLSGTAGSKSTQAGTDPGTGGAYLAGSVAQLPLTNTAFLNPGAFLLALAGGSDIGAGSANFTVTQPLTWTNRDQIAPIVRSSGFMATWTGADPAASVFIAGAGVDVPTNSTSVFLCIAAPGANSFTVPADVLANVPPTRLRLIQSKGVVYIGQWNLKTPAKIAAAGLDFSAVVPMFVTGTTVTFQ
jgi:uncharacterized protein (TIGR03437 family)